MARIIIMPRHEAEPKLQSYLKQFLRDRCDGKDIGDGTISVDYDIFFTECANGWIIPVTFRTIPHTVECYVSEYSPVYNRLRGR